ncbi:fructokinase ScrK [Limosilactobacillus equigenerosi]|uniref:fructokinase n=1 Tax=Limosilactobacillus equigenerosi DSM 18793 = JCM 14505 TaxID=1423742 RepID=A0A0R1UL19_9LACO|nr:fructokinase ScrK [Limosilactobacillus equigenerosi]KRL94022.1 fructokinase [Limosilactobacillus equigenerosi DSM 18793 = JCM 14505]
MLLGSIEAGGTKFVCAVGNEKYEVVDKAIFKTTTPAETLQHVVEYFQQFPDLKAMSVASFGPIDADPTSDKYGFITDTPKIGWDNTDFVGTLKQAFEIPIYWTTDVNGSVYGEYVVLKDQLKHGSLVYYTIGTGVGAGTMQDGHFIGGAGTPEMGHVYLKRHPDDLGFSGICPFHGDCLEGLLSGPTFQARLGIRGEDVSDDDHVWDILAYYAAQACIQVTTILRPEKIIFGGSVSRPHFMKKVREQFDRLFAGYIEVGDLDEYITSPHVPENGSATLGNFALAEKLLK